jgi:hypothetical protein
MTCPEAQAIGVYVLGALDAGERLELERHIRECASCKEAVLQFAYLPGVLHRLTLEDVLALPFDDDADPDVGWLPASSQVAGPAPSPLPKAPNVVPVDSSIRHRRFTSRRTLLAAAAAVVLVVTGGLIGRQMSNDSAASAPPHVRGGVTWSATDGVNGIDTRVQLSSRDWGTDIQVRMDDLQPGQRCMLVVHTRSGQSETTGWWTTTNSREADIPASSSFALSDIARIDVVTSNKTVLASLTETTR